MNNEESFAPGHRPGFMGRIRGRLPEILLEAFSVLIAVLLAFAVEEWREDHELALRADEARTAIVAELRRNQIELRSARESLDNSIVSLQAVAASSVDDPTITDLSVNLNLTLLSSAAWRTALATDSSRRLAYAWMLEISQVQELQTLYLRAQWDAVQHIANMSALQDRPAKEVAVVALGRLMLLNTLHEGLDAAYSEQLNSP